MESILYFVDGIDRIFRIFLFSAFPEERQKAQSLFEGKTNFIQVKSQGDIPPKRAVRTR